MELMFNELSLIPLSPDIDFANTKVTDLVKAFKKAHENGFRKIRSEYQAYQITLSANYSLQDWFTNLNISKTYKDVLYGVLIHPFLKLEDEEIFEEYDNAKYYFEDVDSGITKRECLGLASAYLNKTLSISLNSSINWSAINLSITVEIDGEIELQTVKNIALASNFDDPAIAQYVENLGDLILLESQISPNQKPIHLPAHHGKAELKELCNQLKLSLYVTEMRSTNFGGNRFIRKINDDGSIEIVLHKTQRRYALLIKTTGRNRRETKAIAEILEERYS